jgi:hypothetical protein
MSDPTPSRKDVICDHCGAKVQKKNLKSHTFDIHGKDVKVKERQPAGQQTLGFKKRDTEEQKGNSPKRSKSIVQVLNKSINKENEGVKAMEVEEHGEAEPIVKTDFEKIADKVDESTESIKNEIKQLKEEVLSAVKKEKPEQDESESKQDTKQLIDSAKNVDELCALFSELTYNDELKIIQCNLCVNRYDLECYKKDKTKVTGIINFDKSEDNSSDKMSRLFSNVKLAVKKHLETQTHKAKLIDLKNVERDRFIDKTKADTANEKEAAMRCVRILHFLYRKGRPFTDYPEQVALMVKGKVYMGNINHSKEFASKYLEHLAEVVRDEIKAMLNTVLPQTGFKRPVKIIADKDTTKHRTRQIVCLTTIFPEADELIQALYIDHPIVKHHAAKDTAENIFEAVKDYIAPDQYEGGAYDGPYHHAKKDVPHHLNSMFGVPDEDVHSDHDYLHRCGISEKNARKYGRNYWVDNLCDLCGTVNKDHNYGKSYEEALEIADDMNIKFAQPKFRSDTRFSNHEHKVLKSFYTDLPAYIKHYEQIEETCDSNTQRDKDKRSHATSMLKKLKNKKFFLQLAGTCDIYSVMSQMSCELQTVNLLPFERYDRFLVQLNKLEKMVSTLDDHSSCGESCLWDKLHLDRRHILEGDLDTIQLESDEPQANHQTRSVHNLAQSNQNKTVEQKTNEELKHFIEDLIKEMKEVFRKEDKEAVELTRILTDWKTLAVKVKARGSPLIYALEKSKMVEASKKVCRALREVSEDELENQFAKFINILGKEVETKNMEDLKKVNSKDLIRKFMQTPALYEGIEMVMEATVVSAIKISVESVGESVISTYSIHNNKLRNLKDTTANDEMFISVNGPEIGEADKILAKALDRKFGDQRGWHFATRQNLFRTSGKTVDKILQKKSTFGIY